MIDTTLTYIDQYGIERPLILKYYYSRIEEKNYIYGKIHLQTSPPNNSAFSVTNITSIDCDSMDNNYDITSIDGDSMDNNYDISVNSNTDYGSIDIYPIKNTNNKPGIIDWFLQCSIL